MSPVRLATLKDLPTITHIYNQAIRTTTASFDSAPKSLEEQEAWFSSHGQEQPVLVAELEGEVLGWASLSAWSDRCAYSGTGELSVYVEETARGKGLGTALMKAILQVSKESGFHTVVGRVCSENKGSLRLCDKLGFRSIGTMLEVGQKFGRVLDVVMVQKML